MKKYINRDKNVRNTFKTFEIIRRIFKFLLLNQSFKNENLKWNIISELSKLPKKGSKSHINNRCTITGRSRAVYRLFKISRIKLRDLGNNGNIPGFRKACW